MANSEKAQLIYIVPLNLFPPEQWMNVLKGYNIRFKLRRAGNNYDISEIKCLTLST